MLGNICLKVFLLSALFLDNSGPIPITSIAGIIIGITVALKYGSPTEILLLVKISTIKGYVVPKNTEPQTIAIIRLFTRIDPSLLKNEKYFFPKKFFDFNANNIKE